MKSPPTDTPVEVLPPIEEKSVRALGCFAVGLSALAVVLGLIAQFTFREIPWPLETARLVLIMLASLAALSGITQRPDLWQIWGLACSVAILSGGILSPWSDKSGNLALLVVDSFAGLPAHWDSARMLARVIVIITATATGLLLLKQSIRWTIISALAIFHFGGILCAVTWPEPPPWLTIQVGTRVYMPYLTFVYLRNAYHFYSPEPGPASLLHVLVKYELDEIDEKTGKKKVAHEWVDMPRRDLHMKDPLGLTYYRRLSLTEGVARSIPDLYTPESFNKLDAWRQRAQVAVVGFSRPTDDGRTEVVTIPFAPEDVEPTRSQYRVPWPEISRYLLPSYARHLCHEHTVPGRRVVSVKIYRLEHRILQPQGLLGAPPYLPKPISPFTPWSYRPYYLGEYNAEGELLNPKDPMLYWLVPIISRPNPADPNADLFDDFLSKHAGFEVEWRRR